MSAMHKATKATMLYDDAKGDGGAASEYVSRMLAGAAMIHMHHLMATGPGSFAKHAALGAYGDLADAVDGLAEAYMGCTGKGLVFSGVQVQVGGDCIADVRALYEYVEKSRAALGAESHIQNEVDTVLNVLASMLYKLNRLY
jgi:hypothetical protein